MLHHRAGDEVSAGDVLAEVHYSTGDVATALRLTRAAFTIGPLRPDPRPAVEHMALNLE
jgi:thymidine phosphorylase